MFPSSVFAILEEITIIRGALGWKSNLSSSCLSSCPLTFLHFNPRNRKLTHKCTSWLSRRRSLKGPIPIVKFTYSQFRLPHIDRIKCRCRYCALYREKVFKFSLTVYDFQMTSTNLSWRIYVKPTRLIKFSPSSLDPKVLFPADLLGFQKVQVYIWMGLAHLPQMKRKLNLPVARICGLLRSQRTCSS